MLLTISVIYDIEVNWQEERSKECWVKYLCDFIFFSINIYWNEKYVFMREVLKELNAEYKIWKSFKEMFRLWEFAFWLEL